MSRTRKGGGHRCPEGHGCSWCGPAVARARQEARAATADEWDEDDRSADACRNGTCAECATALDGPLFLVDGDEVSEVEKKS